MLGGKAVGRQGSWFAKVDGEDLPCLHAVRCHWEGGVGHYFEPSYIAGDRQWDAVIDVLRRKRKAILTTSENTDGEVWRRKSYIAVYEVDDVKTDDDGFSLKIVSRLQELR